MNTVLIAVLATLSICLLLGMGITWAIRRRIRQDAVVEEEEYKVEFHVYRVEPNDGFLGVMAADFSPEHLAQTFGGGVYRIDKFVNGRWVSRYDNQRICAGS